MVDAHAFLVVVTTFPTQTQAQDFARQVVEKGLGRCVHIHPNITSIYAWKGKLCQEQEVQVSIKCRQSQYATLENFLQDHHPYDVPQCIALPLSHWSQAYGQWLEEEVDFFQKTTT
jgi:periplasmic divalent cation tolerance protein